MRHGSDTVPQVGERPRTAQSGFRSRAFFVPEPGFSLARLLGEARSEGRPVWHLTDEVTVPLSVVIDQNGNVEQLISGWSAETKDKFEQLTKATAQR